MVFRSKKKVEITPENFNRSASVAFRKSGLDVTFGTLMRWMHKGENVSYQSSGSSVCWGLAIKDEN